MTKLKITRIKWIILGLGFALLVATSMILLPSLIGGNGVSFISKNSKYKDIDIHIYEYAVVWPWEYRTISEKYTNLEIDATEYDGGGRVISETLLFKNCLTTSFNDFPLSISFDISFIVAASIEFNIVFAVAID